MRIFDLYVRQNKGYKAIANILNSESIPSPTGKTWSYTTLWTILHNDAYIGRRTWNRYDYVNYGKKEKPSNEWVVVADAHPTIIDRDTFNAVKLRAKERSPLGSSFKSTGPSPYILRGILKCPMCGVNMVTGANSRKTRGHTRYYYCGTYHRKGSNACKRNAVPKDKLETAVLNALIREFSLLSYPGSLEDEVRRYIEHQNREANFQLARIDDDIKHLKRRIDLAKEDSSLTGKHVNQYINELMQEIEHLKKERSKVDKYKTTLSLDQEQMHMVKDTLKDFANRIKVEPPDVQHSLLSQYINSINYDQFSKNYKLKYQIIISNLSENEISLLDKIIYFGID